MDLVKVNRDPVIISAVVLAKRSGTSNRGKAYTALDFMIMGGTISARDPSEALFRKCPEVGMVVDLECNLIPEAINNRVGDADYVNTYLRPEVLDLHYRSQPHPADAEEAGNKPEGRGSRKTAASTT